MSRKSTRFAGKKGTGTKSTAVSQPKTKLPEPEKTEEQSSVPEVVGAQIETTEVTNGKKTEEPFEVSEAEKKFLQDLRLNDAKAKENAEKQNEEDAVSALPNPEEEAYEAVFAPLSVLNKVHLHCTGVVNIPQAALRKLVKEALAQAKSWDDEEKKIVKKAVAKALPALGEKLIGVKGLPVPKTFSAGRVIQAYVEIYEKHLYLTETLAPAHGTSRKRRRKRSDSSDSSSSSDSDEDRQKSKTKKAEKKALEAVTKEVEDSLRIGKNKYSSEHLYECERLLCDYKQWKNPQDGASQSATCPKTVREFMQRHLTVARAPIMKAYDQKHVKGNEKERKHVTFLLNRMGYLTSKIAKERLARSGRELNRHGRMRKGAELSKKERKESIAGERKWAGEVRWLSILLSKGIQGYRKFDKGKKSQASQAHLHSANKTKQNKSFNSKERQE